MPTIKRSNLHVEGTNDVHVVHHLLLRHGIECPIRGDRRSQCEFAANVPEIAPAGDIDAVLAAIGTAVPVSNDRSVGFILDTDQNPRLRWRAVCDRLGNLGSSCRMKYRTKDLSPMLRTFELVLACG